MKKLLGYFLIGVFLIFILGCQTSSEENQKKSIKEENKDVQDSDEGEESKMTKHDIFEFKHIDKAPEAKEKRPINNVIKIFFDEWSIDLPYDPIAIDIKNNEVYVNPSINIRGFRADDSFQINDPEKVFEILEKYEVQSWKRDYTFEDPETYQDGYSWSLWLQFEDGTVEKHEGAGTDVEKLTPENFREFAKELRSFVEEKLENTENKRY